MTTQSPAYKGHTEDALAQAFDKVHNPTDWKAPIFAKVKAEELSVTIAAIEYYTSTTVRTHKDPFSELWIVDSIGYRRGPAGDH